MLLTRRHRIIWCSESVEADELSSPVVLKLGLSSTTGYAGSCVVIPIAALPRGRLMRPSARVTTSVPTGCVLPGEALRLRAAPLRRCDTARIQYEQLSHLTTFRRIGVLPGLWC